MASSGMLRRVVLVRTDVPEELTASIIVVTRICELGTTLAVTSNRRNLSRRTYLRILMGRLHQCPEHYLLLCYLFYGTFSIP
jgi:hypothetical protein